MTKGSIKRGPDLNTPSYYVNNGGNLLCTQNKLYAKGFGINYDIAKNVSAENIEKDITTLVNFGTRHTLSETESDTRGIGAARRWIKSEFDKISAECGGCLEVYYQSEVTAT